MAQAAQVKEPEPSPAEVVQELVRTASVTLSDQRKVAVRICKVKDIPVFVGFMGLLFNEIGISGGDLGSVQAAVESRMQDPGFILQLIAKHANKVFEISATLTDLPLKEVVELDVDDATVILMKLVEVNYDFFTKKVLPMVRAAVAARIDNESRKSLAKT